MTSRLAQIQARFQQKQIQEKEEKLLRLYESQQQKAFERVGRGSAGSNTSNTSISSTGATTTTTTNGGSGGGGGGKVRQMFEERRQKAGIDRSYPLQPLKIPSRSGGSVDRLTKNNNTTINNNNATTTTTSTRSFIKTNRSVAQIKNGKPVKKENITTIYNNNNGNEFYEEHRLKEDSQKIVDMMNKNNLNDIYLDETLPQNVGNDEPDSSIFRKLPNVGGKMPSQIKKVAAGMVTPKKVNNSDTSLGKTFRKETKPIIKKTTSKAADLTARNSRASSDTMASARSGVNNRPSSKQGPPKATPTGDLVECKYCTRKFATDRIQKHEEICGKASRRKRKTYDATKHRIEGTELEQFARGKSKNKLLAPPSKGTPKKDWRKTHEEFISAIRAAKQAQAHVAAGGKLSDLPPPPPSTNPDYVQCPHCSRKFNEAAAERHIPKCATYLHNKPKPALSKSNKSGSTAGNRFR